MLVVVDVKAGARQFHIGPILVRNSDERNLGNVPKYWSVITVRSNFNIALVIKN